jgi:flavin reductase (DIM6/NTAB) family NADH-FMN oxidoreductase RutF
MTGPGSELADAFADLVAGTDTAMVVVTTVAGGERAGCLVGFHTQCSIEPPRYAVWLSKANHTCRASTFAVHFLDRDQHDLAELFGGRSGDDVDKFGLCAWDEGPDGVPLLRDCTRRIVGRRVALLDEGSDHVCVVVEPARADGEGSRHPLRLSDVGDIDPGHEAEERPHPPTERAAER